MILCVIFTFLQLRQIIPPKFTMHKIFKLNAVNYIFPPRSLWELFDKCHILKHLATAPTLRQIIFPWHRAEPLSPSYIQTWFLQSVFNIAGLPFVANKSHTTRFPLFSHFNAGLPSVPPLIHAIGKSHRQAGLARFLLACALNLNLNAERHQVKNKFYRTNKWSC